MFFSGKVQFLGLIALAAVFCAADVANAQRGFGGFSRDANPSTIVNDKNFKEKFELSDDQVEEMKEAQEEESARQREMFMEMRDQFRDPDADRAELFQLIRDKMADSQKETLEVYKEILLPHQFEGLTQTMGQQNLKNNPKSFFKQALEDEKDQGDVDERIAKFEERAPINQKEMLKKQEKLRVQTLDKTLREAFTSAMVMKIYKKAGLEENGSGSMTMSPQGFRGRWQQQRGGGDRGGDRGDRGDRGGRSGRSNDKGSDF